MVFMWQLAVVLPPRTIPNQRPGGSLGLYGLVQLTTRVYDELYKNDQPRRSWTLICRGRTRILWRGLDPNQSLKGFQGPRAVNGASGNKGHKKAKHTSASSMSLFPGARDAGRHTPPAAGRPGTEVRSRAVSTPPPNRG